MNFEEIELVLPPEKYEEAFSGPGRFAARVAFGIAVLGDEVMIGELHGELPGVEVADKRTIIEDGDEMIQLWLRPESEDARHPMFKLSKPLPA